MKHLLIASAFALTGCVAYTEPVVYRPVQTYVVPAPVYVAPPVVVVRPTPYYYGRPYHR
jgi:hypothetical protein